MKHKSWMLSLAVLAAAGCGKDDPKIDDGNNGADDRYFIAASQDGATYLMAVNDLEKDTTITTGTAIEKNGSFSHYGYNETDAVLAINYQQGNPAPASIFQLNANGVLRETGDFILPVGFATIGAFDNYLVASRSGRTLSGGANDGKTGAIFYLINLETRDVSEKAIVTEKFQGTNRTAEFAGAVDAGNGEFLTGIKLTAPSGQPAASVDSVYVARLDADLNVKAFYKDDRISYSTGEFRSARYSHIANDASGNTYVFSGSHNSGTTRKAGALLIAKGASGFDASYHFDIETASGGHRFKRVYHVAEDYFLLEMYNEPGVGGGQNAATQFGIAKMSTKTFTWLRTGFPAVENIDNTGWPFTANGKAYIGVTAADAQPAVYVIDPKTATAKKGITVTGVASIPGLARLSPQENVQ